MISVNELLTGTLGNAAGTETKFAEDFDTFLTLLTSQLQAQDPLDPVDSSEFTNQLVQFTGVEQAIQTNKNLENLSALTAFFGLNSSVNYIGKVITAEQPAATLQNGNATWQYDLAGRAFENQITIRDEAGNAVRTLFGAGSAGSHTLNWDGLTDAGTQAPDGVYTLHVNATESSGAAVPVRVFTRAEVESVEMANGDALLVAGAFKIPMANVYTVENKEPDSIP